MVAFYLFQIDVGWKNMGYMRVETTCSCISHIYVYDDLGSWVNAILLSTVELEIVVALRHSPFISTFVSG